MNLSCFFKHKWEYKEEMIDINQLGEIYGAYQLFRNLKVTSYKIKKKIRYCTNCHKKECYRGYGYSKWIEIELNISDIRNRKLEKLLNI